MVNLLAHSSEQLANTLNVLAGRVLDASEELLDARVNDLFRHKLQLCKLAWGIGEQ